MRTSGRLTYVVVRQYKFYNCTPSSLTAASVDAAPILARPETTPRVSRSIGIRGQLADDRESNDVRRGDRDAVAQSLRSKGESTVAPHRGNYPFDIA